MQVGIDPEDLDGIEGLENVRIDPSLYVTIGIGNRKIGWIPSWSLPPKKTCNQRCLRYCGKLCYTNKMIELCPSVGDAYEHNLWMLETHPVLTELLIRKFLSGAMPRVMRLHVAGDFYCGEYLDMWRRIARDTPETTFYSYSKMDCLDHASLPDNLRILRSMWPGMPAPRQKHVKRNCWMQDGNETRIADGAETCIGDCPRCGFKCAFGTTDIVIERSH